MKKILIIGNTGFIGSWLSEYFLNKDFQVFGFALKPSTTPNLHTLLKHRTRIKKQIYGNILDIKKFNNTLNYCKPDIIIYLAAQALVIEGYKDPLNTFMTNNNGLINFFEILRNQKNNNLSKVIVFTSDKVYKNLNKKKSYSENDPLGGSDPYSASKACQEIICESYYESFFIKKFSLINIRAGNIIGGGDWSKNRIIPDIIYSIFKNKSLFIRNLNYTRPWQHVLDVCNIVYVIIKKYNKKNFNKYNIGPNVKNKTVNDILQKFRVTYKKNKSNNYKEKKLLNLNSNKIFKELRIKNKINFNRCIELSYLWYKSYYKKNNILDFTKKQIKNY